jgi:hypothetical protein
MDNSGFRAFLAKDERKPETNAKPELTAEERARRKEKQQAGYERRMAIQKRREEALAEASRYVDRAAERRKEQGGRQSYYDEEEERQAKKEVAEQVAASNAPTFAQLGEREDILQQQHRVSIHQSKYLGGDIEHTHLVKGLDFALLQKTRAELSAADAAKVKKKEEEAAAKLPAGRVGGPAAGDAPLSKRGVAARAHTARAVPTSRDAARIGSSSSPGGADGAKVVFNSEFAREVHRSIFPKASHPNRALVEGRVVLIFDARPESMATVPNILVRSLDDLSGPQRSTADTNGVDADLPAGLLSRLSKIATYITGGSAGGSVAGSSLNSGKKKKKEKTGSDAPEPGEAPSILTMAPLVRNPSAGTGRGAHKRPSLDDTAPTRMQLASGGWACTLPRAPGAQPHVAASAASPAATTAEASASTCAGKSEATAQPTIDDDVDDIFGDVGSDYVCEPSKEQLAKAARDSADARLLRGAQSGSTRAPHVLEATEGSEESADRLAPPLSVDDNGNTGADVNTLLKQALAKGGRLASSGTSQDRANMTSSGASSRVGKSGIAGAASMVLEEEEDVDDEALLKAAKGGQLGAPAAPKQTGKDLRMAAMDDSYDELFPDTYQGYANTLQLGPDEDEEQGIVRSKEETEEDAANLGKGKGKRGAVDKEKAEALKKTAKEDRELAAIEKLMEERAAKRQRRDNEGEADAGS